MQDLFKHQLTLVKPCDKKEKRKERKNRRITEYKNNYSSI